MNLMMTRPANRVVLAVEEPIFQSLYTKICTNLHSEVDNMELNTELVYLISLFTNCVSINNEWLYE